jgi:hypothetical protein
MSELVTIYKAHPDNVTQILQLLESRHLHPVVVDDVSKMGAYRSHEVRIAVPQTERDMAVNILAEFEQRDKSRISELVNVTNGIFLLVVALLVLVAVVGIFDKNGKWFIAVWILIVACAGAALIRLAWGKKSRDIK